MGELGDLLELLHDAHARVETFAVDYHDRQYRPSSSDVVVSDAGDGPLQLNWRAGGPWAGDLVRTRRIWLQHPDRLRVEILEGEMLIRLAVRAGSRWWRWDELNGATSGSLEPDEHGVARLPPLLAAPLSAVHRLPGTVRLEPTGAGERAGRPVLRADARPRRHPPGRGSLVYELEFDAEHGSLLRYAEIEDGFCVRERVAIEVLYGSGIDPACFVFAEPDKVDGDLARP